MTMVDGAVTTERQSTTEQWQKPRPLSDRGSGSSGGIKLAGAGLVATLLVVLLLWWAAARQPQVAVPNLVGMSRVNAEALLNGMGLKVRATNDQVADQEAGTVLRTDPSAGQNVDQGDGVSLTLASPPPAVTPSPAAQTSAAQEPQVAPESPAAQQPAPVVVPSPVRVPAPVVVVPPPVVEAPPGPAVRPIPDVVGFYQYRAGRVLAQDRLRVGSVVEEESNQPSGTVLRTDPRAGTAVWPNSTVDLVVAKSRQVAVPDVAGYDRVSAERMLKKNGLKVGLVREEESTKPSGTVLRTDPRAGATVRAGSTVNLVIARAPATTEPPAKTEPSATTKPPAMSKPGDTETG
jgi:beta-lactam-binding protein with PASTA domain